MARKRSSRVTESSGNVFRDLGFRREEAEHLLVRADLLIHLEKARIDLFSTDTLIDMLARVGIEVSVVLKPVRRHRAA